MPTRASIRCCSLALLLLGVVLSGTSSAATYNATFTRVSTSSTPGAPVWRGWSAMTWVGSLEWIVMWGGSSADFVNDIQALDPLTADWTALQQNLYCPGNTSFARPNGSDENGVVWDAISDLLWIYNGGSGYRCVQGPGRTAGAGTTSTSIIDPSLPATTNDFYKGWMVRVNGAYVAVNAYSAANKTLILSSPVTVTAGSSYDLFADMGGGTWWYDFSTGQWGKMEARHWGYTGLVPAGRLSPGFVGDGTKAFLFGGLEFDNATYKLDFATRSYSIAVPQGAAAPPARGQIQAQFVYDSTHNVYVLFGGRCYDPGRCSYQASMNDTWLYDPVANRWTDVSTTTRPPARNQGSMYFDQAHGVVVLYGGAGGTGVLNDLWTFDVATRAWTQQAVPATNPGGVYLAQVAYAPTSGCGYIVYGLAAGANATGGTWRLCLASNGGNASPTASFTTTPSSTTVGSPIALSAAMSDDPDGTIVNYAWNFGDGTTGSGVSTSKSYASPGTYTVTLTVTDNGGRTASTSRSVSITTSSTGTNVAAASAGGVASASSTYGAGYAAAYVINGERAGSNWGNGGGWADATPNAFPDWVQINFNGQKTIDRVAVYSVQDNYLSPVQPTDTMTFSLHGLTAFSVAAWNGSAWVTVGSVSGNTLVKRTVSFAPVTTDRIRINVASALATYSRITEVEAFGTGSSLPASTTTLSSSSNPALVGAAVTFTATVSGTAPSGTVAFRDNGATLSGCAAVPLAGSGNTRTAACTTTSLTVGTHPIVASYAGNAGNGPSSSAPLSQVVNGTGSTGTNVAAASAGAAASASSTYDAGYAAAYVINGERAGSNWGNGGGWADATPNAFPDWVQINFNGQKTIDRVIVYSVQDNYLSPVQPTDTMTFSLHGLTAFSIAAWNGSAWVTVGSVSGNNLVKRTVSFAPVTTDRIRINVASALATYSRITEVEAFGTGSSLPASTTTLSSSSNPALVGAAVTFTATVSGTAPSGTVAFRDNGATLSGCAAVPLAGSGNTRTAACTTTSLTVGTHPIVASYAGNAGNGPSSSAPLSQVVNGTGSTGTNVAAASAGAAASASSTYDAGYAAAYVINGERAGSNWGNGGGWADATPNAFPDWVQINFNGQKTIDRVIVYSVQDNYLSPVQPTDTMTFSLYGLTAFSIVAWNGSAWVTVGSVSGNNLVKRTVSFAPITADRIRINVASALATYSRITEVEAWTD